ncbi:hypothetical protein [Leifsonia sp. 1010]|uniref:hypothetical protein n=1 Tax=Leifsonia sp. 1010 TaxID=2817769 RepID=UPI002865FE32|nr:hypothetical protein [Leifsonia sp. 1010]MDR6611234.1 hypothetical protein [Leifsonia sp. 1010]
MFDDWDGAALTDREILEYSGPSSKYPLEDVELADRPVGSTGILEDIKAWAAEERQLAGKRNGGRPPYIGDRASLVVLILLAREGRPLLITEMGNVLHRRPTPEGRELLEEDGGLSSTRIRTQMAV